MRDASISHKVVLRLVVAENGYLAELECKGQARRFFGPCEKSAESTGRAALAKALSALKRPCSVECYIDEACAEGFDRPAPLPNLEHHLQLYFLSPKDDPSMNDLHSCLSEISDLAAA